ncbi:uncharacterized protein LOC135475371 isoform X2 [Liolophura sinensis]|uniref:uncharacterized protein LOC135475371 isoform X2 n=1 Tax=Liolophura sinensis TaxID=3198878 RepID=UPI0031597A73
MMYISVLLLTLHASCSCVAAQENDFCSVTANSLCITRETFSSWNDARECCIDRGGDLAIPSQDTKDVDTLISARINQVWVGGRVSRVWTTDNSSYYYGTWKGCSDNIAQDVDFHPSNSLSECLQTCYSFHCAYVKESQCGCSNSISRSRKYDCEDPFRWDGGVVKGTNTHRFDRKRPSVKEFVKYGSSFLWITKYKLKWTSAGLMCEQGGGTLAKLNWESPLLQDSLYDIFSSGSLWLGVGPAKWRFINGRLVSDMWPDVKQDYLRKCLVWKGSGLEAHWCPRSYPYIPAACALPYETTTATIIVEETPTDPLDVSTVDELSTVITDTNPPSSQSSRTTVITHQPSGETDHVTNESLVGVTLDMSNTEMSSPALYTGVGVSMGLLVLCVVTVMIVCRVRKRSSQSGAPDSRLRREKQYNHNVGYDLRSGSIVWMTELDTNHDQTNMYINGNIKNNTVEEVFYSTVKAKTPSSDAGITSPKSNCVDKRVDDALQPGADYDKLAVPKASGCHTKPTPLQSVVSRKDPTYVNYNESSVTSPYDHVIARGSPKKNNENYDELHIDNITCAPTDGVGDFSVYDHVSSDI